MTTNADLLPTVQERLYPCYRPAPFVVARAQGSEVFDVEGGRWLDMAAGLAVCSLGHGHPDLVKTIADQAARVMHVSNYFVCETTVRLADELCRRTSMDRAFFCSSGTEANESLLKLARHHFFLKGEPSRLRVIAFENGFHGRTLGALSMTANPKYREGFGPLGPVTHVPFGDVEAVRRAMGDDVAAVIVEPIQGEGGVYPAPPGFLSALRDLCDQHGALLFADEVQTGVGRTGSFLATERAGVRADAVALAKGLGGGFPIGAMLTRESLAAALPPGTHGTTFGGNPLASAAALAVLSVIDRDDLCARARDLGEVLGGELRKVVSAFPGVFEQARGEGLLQGLVLREGLVARDVVVSLQGEGLLLTAAGTRVLRFTPALTVSEGELKEAVQIVRAFAPRIDIPARARHIG